MPNLKDIKTRIESVKTTRQVTSAMKMVSAAKLKKAQDDIVKVRPYTDKLNEIILELIGQSTSTSSLPLTEQRKPDKVLIVMITSNRGLCGAFNSNISKEVIRLIKDEYASLYKNGDLDVFAIGKQGEKLLKSADIQCPKEYSDIYNNLSFNAASKISEELISLFLTKKYDKIILVHNEFINAAAQNVSAVQFLPMQLPTDVKSKASPYIFEPEEDELIKEMLPQALKTLFFKILLDSIASEHGARMTSMHKATDNATDLIKDLELSYNKARQASITNEIIEIVGGAEALAK